MIALGPTVIGALVGAAAGVVVHVILETKTDLGEMPWFAIVTGLTTGLGVRFLNGPKAMNRASFLRAGIAAVVALAAIVLAPTLKAMVVQQQSPGVATDVAVVANNEETDASEETTDEGAINEDASAQRHQSPVGNTAASGIGNVRGQTEFDTWQFIFIAVGALLAYECARGKDAGPTTVASTDPPPEADDEESGNA